MHLAVLGAFPFPLPQGSQTYARDQARALANAGARVTFLCYGSGTGRSPADLEIVRVPKWLSPRALRAGPSPAKPLADTVLAAVYARAHRRLGFDAALAHNAEAALAAIAARPFTGVPVVYVAHTLMGFELASYGPAALARPLDAAGGAVDRGLARAADATLALCRAAADVLGPAARRPPVVVPPGLDPTPDPEPEEIARACERAQVQPGRFVLYAGNLDGYQNLVDLDEAARRLPGVPVIVATHAAASAPGRSLRTFRVESADEARALTFGAGVAVLPRRRCGGFPIKLLNYMEARRAIVAHPVVADGLEHDRSAWLLPEEPGGAAMADAIRRLLDDPDRSRRLGEAARAQLERRHAWKDLAARTLELVESLISGE